MSDGQGMAWLAAATTAAVVVTLFLRRSAPLGRAGGRYRLLERATLIATAVAAGVMMGLIAYLIVSSLGG